MNIVFIFFSFLLRLHGFFCVGFDTVSLMVGDSVTLLTDVKINQEDDSITWNFNSSHLAQITGDQREICTDFHCDKIFRDRLEVDHQTGSLTIKSVKYEHTGYYDVSIFSGSRDRVGEKSFLIFVHGVSAKHGTMKRKSAKEGESVALDPGVIKNTNDLMTWYFKDSPIAEITGDQSKTCEDGDERFRDRLKVNNQTGSLTITNTSTTDSGCYKLQIISRNNSVIIRSVKSFIVFVTDFFGANTDEVSVSVMKGDSVTLHTDVETDQQDIILWYFNGFQIAEITGDESEISRDDQCDGRFRDRLKLDNQTGSLTITDITNTDSGLYELLIFSYGVSIKNISVAVHDVPAAQQDERKSVHEGESVILDAGVVKKTNEVMAWYFNDTLIAEITGNQSKICTYDQCEKRFRDRLEVNNQTGSLTIINIRTTDSGRYKLQITSRNNSVIIRRTKSFIAIVTGVIWLGWERVVVHEDSITLHTNVETNQQEIIIWYFNGIRIAEISGDLSYICTDVQCNKGNERFRDKLELDHQTGSLTITDISIPVFTFYRLEIISSIGIKFIKHFGLVKLHPLCPHPYKVPVSVMEGDSVTLHTNFETNQQKRIIWYFKDIRIAAITRDLICTDVQCNKGTERFRGRLKQDHQTGSLTIKNTRNTDTGQYILRTDYGCDSGVFIVDVPGVSAALRDKKRKSVKEGESVTLDPGVVKKTNDLMAWYFNDTLIAEISGDQSKTCTDDQCDDGDERFRDRLKLDHQTGSLTIMNIDTTDLGLYKLQITSRNESISISSFRSFGVNVTAADSGPSMAVVAGASAAAAVVVLLVTAAAVVIYYRKHQAKRNDIGAQSNDQVDGVKDSSPDQNGTLLMKTTNESPPNQTENETLM